MVWVILRSQADAMPISKSGAALISSIRGLQVDPDILPHGGIVLKELVVSEPSYQVAVSEPTGRDIMGNPLLRDRFVRKERRVLRTEPGAAAMLYVCEATEDDAQYYASIRGWQAMAFAKEADIPRRSQGKSEADASEVVGRDVSEALATPPIGLTPGVIPSGPSETLLAAVQAKTEGKKGAAVGKEGE